jgi:hypothetical protein
MSVRVNLTPDAITLLNELAGGERHKSEYLQKMIPLLHQATSAARRALQQHQAQAVAEAVTAAIIQNETSQ